MRENPQTSMMKYLLFAMLASAAILMMKPIYSGNLAKFSATFAPVHVALATQGSCDKYTLSASTTRKKFSRYEVGDPIRFYTISSDKGLQICAMARGMITAPIAQLALGTESKGAESRDDLAKIAFITITMGSENFYLSQEELAQEEILVRIAPTTTPAPHDPESEKTPESKALDSSKLGAESNLRHSGVIGDSSADSAHIESAMIDLSSYKLLESSTILNQYSSLWGGFVYYFLTPPYLFIWLFCAFVLLAWRESRIESRAGDIGLDSHGRKSSALMFGLFGLFVVGLVLRLYNYDSFGFWGDELYSVGVVGYPDGDFSSVFRDPGNPPFYNFLLKIWLHIFGYTPASARGFSVLLGSLGVLSMYVFLKAHALTLGAKEPLSPKQSLKSRYIALLGAGLFACSYVAIGAAHEVRGYVLELSLIPLVLYFLFNCYKHPSWRNLLGYCVSAICLCNTHYFGAIVVFSGFLVSVVLLWGSWRRLFVLLLCDVLIALSLAPFFIITAFSKALGDASFNTWIPTPSIDLLFMVLSWSLGTSSAAFVLLVLVICAPKLRSPFLLACIMMMILCVVVPFGVSFIRPIFYPKYAIYAIYPLMLSVLCVGLVQLADKLMRSRIQQLGLVALGAVMIGVALFDPLLQPIGLGDSSRAKLRFITQDSHNASRDGRAYIACMGRVFSHIISKQRQYELYGFSPAAEFVQIERENLADVLGALEKKSTLYLDAYAVDGQLLDEILKTARGMGARVDTIPFGMRANENLIERQDVIYRVAFGK